MTDVDKDTGIIYVLLERMEKIRLPRALDLKAQVERGETLSSTDIDFLSQVLEDAKQLQPILERHPEYQNLVGRVIHLYHEITSKALENEQRS